jgi:hypothetical protein
LKVPQVITARKLRRGAGFAENDSYLNEGRASGFEMRSEPHRDVPHFSIRSHRLSHPLEVRDVVDYLD